MEQRFTASLNTVSKVITSLVLALTVFIGWFLYDKLENDELPKMFVWLYPALMVAVCLGLYLYRPLGYSVTPYSFVVRRPLKDVVIDRNEIGTIRTVSREEMGLPIRTFGNGGLFGFTGYYFSNRIGKMLWYATRNGNYVLLQLKNGRQLIVTPDDPSGLVQSLPLLDQGNLR